jgi:AcrR family transcriptional regulator
MAEGDGDRARPSPRRRRSEAPRRRRLDPQSARAQLLAAGLELVSEEAVGQALEHLRINDLAATADLTSGAFYHYWDNQEDYRREVLDALLVGDRIDARPGFLPPCPSGSAATEVLDTTATHALQKLREDPHQRLALGLWAQDAPDAHARLAVRYRRADTAWARRLGCFLEPRGRAPLAPWTLTGLGAAIVALLDGLVIHHATGPDSLAEQVTPLVMALVVGATDAGRPAPVPEPSREVRPPVGEAQPGRRRLVDLGVESALEHPLGNALDHIRASDVTRRLGLTIGAFYYYWDSQDDYRDDLVDALFAAHRYVDPGRVADLGREIVDAADFDTAVREGTAWYWSVASDHPDNRVQFGFAALDDPYIAPRLAAEAADLRGAWHGVVDALLERFGRTIRPPLDRELIVLGMGSVMDGLILRHGLDSGELNGTGLGADAEGWTLWGRVCQALLAAGTVERGADLEDLATLADRVLSPSA